MAHFVLEKSAFGNKRAHAVSCTADAASGNIDTGLSVVDFYSWAPISMATGAATMKKNIGSGSTARMGMINFNSMAIGDSFFIVAYGR